MRKWFHAFRQTTTYLGVAVLAIIWGGIYLLSGQEYDRAYEDAVRQGGNLARVLEEYIRRVVQASDGALLALRRAYQDDPQHFDLAHWVARTQANTDLMVEYGICSAEGFVLQSSQGPVNGAVSIADRPYFNFQAHATADELYISPPVAGTVSRKLVIVLTRRLTRPDGAFDGVVGISLDIQKLGEFFGSLDIGRGGAVSLVGLDGIVRARGGPDQDAKNYAGISIIESPIFAKPATAPVEHYWNSVDSDVSAKFGGVSKLISYRRVSGLPLVAIVGLPREQIFRQANETLRHYVLAGGILTAIALMVVALGAIGRARVLSTTAELQQSKQSLEQSNHLLHTALTNMAHGLSMFDRDLRLVMCNDRYAEMYGLRPELTKPGTPLRAILEARIPAEMSPQEAAQFIRERMERVVSKTWRGIENKLKDGRSIAVSYEPLDDGGWVAIHHDVTEQKRTERALLESAKALKTSNARFAAALANMSQGLCMIDADQRVLVVNERYRQIYNLPEEMVKPGTTIRQIVEYRARSGNYNGPDPDEYIAAQFRNSTDIEKLGNGRVVLILRHAMADGCWLMTHEDITERWRTETRVAYLAHHDALTGLANRPSLVEKIEDACSRYRWRGEKFNLLMVDLDRFKQVNDTFGHPSGDELLKQVAERLKGALRETDVLARLGGDEFAIIQATDDDRTEAAEALAARIIALIAEPFSVDGIEVGIGASIGIALAPEHGTAADDLLKKADLALYHAKASGRNRYAVFEFALGQAAVEKHTLENELRRALAKKEFEVHFQPIVETKSLKLCGAEALIRWQHPERGLIPPDQFIPLAEESGTILQIGEWVLEAACKEAMTWPAPVKVAVNLSAVQLRNASLLDYVMCVLVETGLPPERLELEVTETALLEYGADCIAILRKLKNLGITVVLDDFGTGYSSLNQLTMFPFDKIKIDKSFTKNMTTRVDCAAIISAVLALAQSLNIQTTAEGVETEDQLRILSLAGVSAVQGYLIQRPAPAAELKFDGYLIPGVVEDAA
jgi:diguanylate cyclase (GGDEF)-like protein/PAS domain S-box-containing protein